MQCSHEFGPVYNSDSKILILGSFPSVKSRENSFYYAHPQNRFWKLLYFCLDENYNSIDFSSLTIDDKKRFLYKNNIALWDSIESCDIIGSSDSSITNVKINDINKIISESKIQRILFNGSTSYNILKKYYDLKLLKGITTIVLPSTSPANAKYSFENLVDKWNICLK